MDRSAFMEKAVPTPHFAGKCVLVIGLGRFGGGVGVTRWLAGQGARVTVSDQAPAESLAESVEALRGLDVQLELGGHGGLDARRFDLAVVSPAVRRDSPVFRELAQSGLAWTTEINLFCERCPAAVVAVTGSFGKSTTCAMLARVLQGARGQGVLRHRETFLGGNIGGSLLSELPRMTSADVVVLELSNAQLEHTPRIAWRPVAAVITNIHPHHLDRYAAFGEYAGVKLNVLGNPNRTGCLVLGPVHAEVGSMVQSGVKDIAEVVTPRVPGGLRLKVPGSHNRANAGCVMAACDLLGIEEQLAREALRDFRGLPHRLEHVRRLGGVDFVNDSKSTAPQATGIALRALCDEEESGEDGEGKRTAACAQAERRIILIVGGQDKPEPLEDMPAEAARHCRAVIGMGECGERFAAAIRTASETAGSSLIIENATGLEQAVSAAARLAREGETVLFSPGAPSFDAYKNFAERGEHFVRLVNAMG